MRQKIVVMGGSFNPPTLAHLRLMQAAMQSLEAYKGIFVPVSHAYLKRKMRKSAFALCLREELRDRMLTSMCDPGMGVSRVEFEQPNLYTEQTLQVLQDRYPQDTIYFLAGADKLPLIRNWAVKTDFLQKFHVAIVCRDGVDPMLQVMQDKVLSPYAASFALVEQPKGMEKVSSTVIREAFLTDHPDAAAPYLHKEVMALLKESTPMDYPPEIESFKGDYAFLSNRFLSDITYEGLTYRCAEAAFQAAGCKNENDRLRFIHCDAAKAKTLGARLPRKENWEQLQAAVMANVLQAKFSNHPNLAQKLLETQKYKLINGINGKDHFWGMDLYTCKGENKLGELLMQLREQLRQEAQTDEIQS